jgi:hypothetical protein
MEMRAKAKRHMFCGAAMSLQEASHHLVVVSVQYHQPVSVSLRQKEGEGEREREASKQPRVHAF